jgi:hypothetical protein
VLLDLPENQKESRTRNLPGITILRGRGLQCYTPLPPSVALAMFFLSCIDAEEVAINIIFCITFDDIRFFVTAKKC